MKSRFLALCLVLSACGGTTGTTGTTGSLTAADCTDTWSGYGSNFFATYCRSCHQHSGQYGTQASVQASLSSVSSMISSGRMPQGTGLPTAELTRIEKYLACGAL